jgi:hypothetical protein
METPQTGQLSDKWAAQWTELMVPPGRSQRVAPPTITMSQYGPELPVLQISKEFQKHEIFLF